MQHKALFTQHISMASSYLCGHVVSLTLQYCIVICATMLPFTFIYLWQQECQVLVFMLSDIEIFSENTAGVSGQNL